MIAAGAAASTPPISAMIQSLACIGVMWSAAAIGATCMMANADITVAATAKRAASERKPLSSAVTVALALISDAMAIDRA